MNDYTESSIQSLLVDTLFPTIRWISIPNVSYGYLNHEADLLTFAKSGNLIEVEIKISKQDFKQDAKKNKHRRLSEKIYKFYYCMPKDIWDKSVFVNYIKGAGIIVCDNNKCEIVKGAKPNPRFIKITDKDRLKLLRLCHFRYWHNKGGKRYGE